MGMSKLMQQMPAIFGRVGVAKGETQDDLIGEETCLCQLEVYPERRKYFFRTERSGCDNPLRAW